MSADSRRVLQRVVALATALLLTLLFAPSSAAAGAAKAKTTVKGFATARVAVRVGGEIADAVTVRPASARSVTVQYRRAGTTRFRNATTGTATAAGAFTARLHPRASGIWEFRLRVTATAKARAAVTPVRTVAARGKAVASTITGFDAAPAYVVPGTTLTDSIVIEPKAVRTVEVWTRQGSAAFTLTATGRSTSSGAYRVAFRPSGTGSWQLRVVVWPSRTARGVASPIRTVTVATPPAPTPVTPPPVTPPPVALTPRAVLRINDSTASTVKLTVGDWTWFDASSSRAPVGRSLVSGLLDYGDGSAPQRLPIHDEEEDYSYWESSHTYTTTGTMHVTLTVTDSAGTSATTTVSVLVFAEPTLALTAVHGPAGSQLTIPVGAWTPPGTSFLGYYLDFGDGTDSPSGTVPPATVTHTYAAPGNYRFSVDAWNDAGGYVYRAVTIQVGGEATTARLAVSTEYYSESPVTRVTAPTTLYLDATGSFAEGNRTLTSAAISFSDGTAPVTLEGDPADWRVRHDLVTPGTVTITLTVRDSTGTTAEQAVSITAFAPPSLTIRPSTSTVAPGGTVTFTVTSTTPVGTAWTGYEVWGIGDEGGPSGDGAPPATFSLTFATAGDYVIEMYAHNDAGGTARDEVPVAVR